MRLSPHCQFSIRINCADRKGYFLVKFTYPSSHGCPPALPRGVKKRRHNRRPDFLVAATALSAFLYSVTTQQPKAEYSIQFCAHSSFELGMGSMVKVSFMTRRSGVRSRPFAEASQLSSWTENLWSKKPSAVRLTRALASVAGCAG